MKLQVLLGCLAVCFSAGPAAAQISTDVIGQHALGPGSSSPVKGTAPGSCQYCHAPHSGLDNDLWNQKLTVQSYTPYSSSTYAEKGNSTVPPQTQTNLCLSCHDGTIAAGTTVVYGQIATGKLTAQDTIANLQPSHPVSLVLPLNDAPDLVASLYSSGTTADAANVKLVRGNLECTTCHNPHVESKDTVARNFLVKDSSSGALCLACHDPNRVLNGAPSGLAGWAQSIHATSTTAVQNLPYGTLALNACLNCHADHNAAGPDWLLRGAGDQVCLNCHSGTSPVNVITPAARGGTVIPPRVAPTPTAKSARWNVAAEYAKIGHPLASGTNQAQTPPIISPSQAARSGRVIMPNNPTLTGCIDCHNPHSVQATTSYTAAPQVRASQVGVVGVSATNSVAAVKTALAEYEVCFRCHGASRGKDVSAKFGYAPLRSSLDGDPLNLIPQFGNLSRSSHPVAQNRTSSLPQPSLRQNMLNLDGSTLGREMGQRIYCSDCHNSDDNREFGGSGPNGPHGSKWSHILERRYEFSKAVLPGNLISNLYPSPDTSSQGPYALCGKCHNLTTILQDSSFKGHSSHLNAGFSCSTCHTAHGTQISAANSTGERLVSFDLKVVAPVSGAPISYNRSRNTCSLTCHQVEHSPDGSVRRVGTPSVIRK